METINQALTKYEQGLRLSGKSQATIKSYMANMRNFFIYSQSVIFTGKMIQDYLNQILKQGIEKSTYNQIMYSIKAYCEIVLGLGFPNNIQKLKVRNKIKIIPAKQLILRSIYNLEELKEKVIMLCLYDGMLRRAELQTQLIKDIDFKSNQLYVRAGKGDKDRIVDLSPVTTILIQDYLTVRNSENPYLIAKEETKNKYMSKSYIKEVVSRAGYSVSCTNWHPHLLRAAGATHSFKETGDLLRISKKLGHSDIMTTMHYLHLQREDIAMPKGINYKPLVQSGYEQISSEIANNH